jgi:hypothetical protein
MSESTSVSALVQGIMEIAAPITQMLDHMTRAPGEPDIDDVLRTLKRLLEDVLSPLESHEHIGPAVDVLETALPLILENIYLVPLQGPRRATHRRRGARGC